MRAAPARWAVGILLTFIVLAGAISLGLIAWAKREGALAVQIGLSAAGPWLLAWRLMLYVVLMTYWREIMEWLSPRMELSTAARTQLVAWRWRAGMGLLMMDLILVEDLLGILQRVFF